MTEETKYSSLSEMLEAYEAEQAARPWIIKALDAVHTFLFYRLKEKIEFILTPKHKLEKEHKQAGFTYWDRPAKYMDKWGADHVIAWKIYPVLVRFRRADRMGCPTELYESSMEDNQCTAWDEILDEIVFTFEEYLHRDDYVFDDDFGKARGERLQQGLELFTKYYMNLWD